MCNKGNKKIKTQALWIVGLSLALFFILYKSDAKIVYSDVEAYISILQNTSAMIFAIVGLWVSSTYPTTKQAMTDNNVKVKFGEFGTQSRRLETLVGVLIISAIVMLSLLSFHAVKMIVPSFSFYHDYQCFFRYAGISFLFSLGICQFIAVLYVILINVTFINDLYKIVHDNDSDDQF